MSRVTEIDSSRLQIFMAFQNDPLQFLSSLLYDGDMVSLRSSRKSPLMLLIHQSLSKKF